MRQSPHWVNSAECHMLNYSNCTFSVCVRETGGRRAVDFRHADTEREREESRHLAPTQRPADTVVSFSQSGKCRGSRDPASGVRGMLHWASLFLAKRVQWRELRTCFPRKRVCQRKQGWAVVEDVHCDEGVWWRVDGAATRHLLQPSRAPRSQGCAAPRPGAPEGRVTTAVGGRGQRGFPGEEGNRASSCA